MQSGTFEEMTRWARAAMKRDNRKARLMCLAVSAGQWGGKAAREFERVTRED
jgi:hypothetical protein